MRKVGVYGQDYGFSADPTTLVKTNIDKANKIKLTYTSPYANL